MPECQGILWQGEEMEGAEEMKHILGMTHLAKEEIESLLDSASSFKEILLRPIKKVPTLRGRTVVHLFFEPSTRTKLSFELAAKRLSADTVSISSSMSSLVKGETLVDTARNVEAMKPDVVVMRHGHSGACHLLARHIGCSVINAGDGINEHPSQALLDMFTVLEHKGRIEGLKIAIVGDIAHSRVAHSDIIGFTRLGATVTVAGPGTFFPCCIEELGALRATSVEEALEGADVVMALRIQRERQGRALVPSFREYAAAYGINMERLRLAKPDAIVMHPGPINRGVEMSPDVADCGRSVILDQVTNGVAVRMALLAHVLAGADKE